MDKYQSTGMVLPVERKDRKVKIFMTCVYAFFIVLCLIFVVPIIWLILSAFKDTQEFLRVPPSLFPEKISIEKLSLVWRKADLSNTYISTLTMVAGDLFFLILCNGLAGYVLSRLKPKGSILIFYLVLWTIMMPDNLAMVPRFKTFIDFPVFHLNFTDTFVPMWMMMCVHPYDTLLFKNFFDGIPRSYIEAARIDGCKELSIFTKIILPLSKPIVMTVAIFGMVRGWGAFFWPYLMIKKTELQPIGVKLLVLQGELPVDQYLMMAVFAIIPPIILFLIFQRYIMKGVSGGGEKG